MWFDCSMSKYFITGLALLFAVSCHSEQEVAPDIYPARPAVTNSTDTQPDPISTPKSELNEYREALADIWIESDEYVGNGIAIERKCSTDKHDAYIGSCNLRLRANKRLYQTFSVGHGRKEWLKYGFIELLGKGSKQLIVFTYSGGAHCCYDYVIYNLKPTLRVLYDSNKYDSANVVGNELVPIDIDGDGILEFYQDVMAFDYMGAAGHAGATFPPAIFRYDIHARKYVPATKHFPDFVIKQLESLMAMVESRETGQDALDEYLVRTRFLFMVYAGRQDEAWKYLDEEYKSKNGKGYQEKFKEQFRKEFKEIFSKDPTYLSIYAK